MLLYISRMRIAQIDRYHSNETSDGDRMLTRHYCNSQRSLIKIRGHESFLVALERLSQPDYSSNSSYAAQVFAMLKAKDLRTASDILGWFP